jgi:hypothetical protein
MAAFVRSCIDAHNNYSVKMYLEYCFYLVVQALYNCADEAAHEKTHKDTDNFLSR